MQSPTDEKHKASLALLEEVLVYLERLPLVPATYEVRKKIAAHLADPYVQVLTQTETERTGGYYTPAGRCLVQASLRGDALTVRIPALNAVELLRPEGFTFELSSAGNGRKKL